jgi:hypothetical protein
MVTWDSVEPRRRVEPGTETAEQGEAHPTPSAACQHRWGLDPGVSCLVWTGGRVV